MLTSRVRDYLIHRGLVASASFKTVSTISLQDSVSDSDETSHFISCDTSWWLHGFQEIPPTLYEFFVLFCFFSLHGILTRMTEWLKFR